MSHLHFTQELLDFQLLDSNSTIDLSWWWEWHAICTGGHDMWCDGILHSQKLWVYLLLQCTAAAKVCVQSVLKISGLELSHLLQVTKVESLNLSHSCRVTWAQDYTKYVKNHVDISKLWTLNLEGFDNQNKGPNWRLESHFLEQILYCSR